MSGPNPYSVSPIIFLVDKSVRVSTQWFNASNLWEAFSSDECVIMQRENFIGTVMQVHPTTNELRVKFGTFDNWRKNCFVWIPCSQVQIQDNEQT